MYSQFHLNLKLGGGGEGGRGKNFKGQFSPFCVLFSTHFLLCFHFHFIVSENEHKINICQRTRIHQQLLKMEISFT